MKLEEITAYHGTAKTHKVLKPPIFVSTDKEGAGWFASERSDDGQGVILRGELLVKNPLHAVGAKGYKQLLQLATDAGIEYDADPFFAATIAEHSEYDGTNVNDLVYVPAFVTELKRQGYDSLRTYDVLENTEIEIYVLFDAKQFKVLGTV